MEFKATTLPKYNMKAYLILCIKECKSSVQVQGKTNHSLSPCASVSFVLACEKYHQNDLTHYSEDETGWDVDYHKTTPT